MSKDKVTKKEVVPIWELNNFRKLLENLIEDVYYKKHPGVETLSFEEGFFMILNEFTITLSGDEESINSFYATYIKEMLNGK
jgi:hypothetical protein